MGTEKLRGKRSYVGTENPRGSKVATREQRSYSRAQMLLEEKKLLGVKKLLGEKKLPYR